MAGGVLEKGALRSPALGDMAILPFSRLSGGKPRVFAVWIICSPHARGDGLQGPFLPIFKNA